MAFERQGSIISGQKDLNLSLKSYKNLSILFVLIALSFIARVYELPFSYGVSFTFCSALLFIILRFYGIPIAVFASMAINISAWYIFDSSIFSAFFTLEIFIVGILWIKKKGNLYLMTLLYWVFIGTPGLILAFYYTRGFIGTEGSLFVVNMAINGMLNVLCADFILSYTPFEYIFGRKDKRLIDLNKMLFHLSIAAVIGPFFAYTLVDGWLQRDKVNVEILGTIQTSGSNIMEQVKDWETSDLRKVRLRSPIYLKKLKSIIENNSFDGKAEIYVVDKSSNIYITNQEKDIGVYDWNKGGYSTLISEDVYHWIPLRNGNKPDISRWGQSFYIMVLNFENVDLQLQVKVSLRNYIDSIWKNYLNKFSILLVFCVAAAFISLMMTRFLSRDISKLTQSTTGLPDKLKRQETIEWPNPSITQINSLASNFQVMSDNLVSLFTEAKIMNNQLLTQTKELESSREQMKRLAYYDSLTGLPNRLYFNGYLEDQLDSIVQRHLAVMFIDLNRFKQVNDTLGHEVGDMLIKEVANRLRCFLKVDSFVARLGGDEFVVVLNDADKKKAINAAVHINKSLAEPVSLCKNDQVHELFASASIGISMYPDDATERTTLMKYADLAMYSAKETGENSYRFYSEIGDSNMSEQLFLEQSLNKALEGNEIIIYYQPKVDVKTKEIIGMESLIRWMHPQMGLIPPSKFIPLAEETGIITQIGEWVLIESCIQNKKWQDMGLPKLRISVNLSVRQFHGNNIVKTVIKALEISGLSPEYLELEITEGFLIKNTDYTIAVLKELNQMGVYVSIDDFGTGYSSLGRLKELPIHFLKIDKTFIANISTEKNNNSIVTAIIQLAHSMELKVVAEGVETIEDWDALELMGCDEIQGYFVSKPVPKADFENLVKSFTFSLYR